jgi:hypothetical protein
MATLHVHLQEGFAGERVTVSVDGRPAIVKSQVTTRPQLGLADMVELDVPAGTVTIDVALEERGETHSLTIDAAETPFLGLSIAPDGSLASKLSATTFGYV